MMMLEEKRKKNGEGVQTVKKIFARCGSGLARTRDSRDPMKCFVRLASLPFSLPHIRVQHLVHFDHVPISLAFPIVLV